MKAVFTTRTIRPRSTAQTIPENQTPWLVRPTRKAVRRTVASRTTGSVAAGDVVVGHAEVDPVEGAAVEEAEEGAAVATFRGAADSRMPIARGEGRPNRTASPVGLTKGDPIKSQGAPSAKGRLF